MAGFQARDCALISELRMNIGLLHELPRGERHETIVVLVWCSDDCLMSCEVKGTGTEEAISDGQEWDSAPGCVGYHPRCMMRPKTVWG